MRDLNLDSLKAELAKKENQLAEASKTAGHKYCCPVSTLIMQDPVVAPSGTSYERAELIR